MNISSKVLSRVQTIVNHVRPNSQKEEANSQAKAKLEIPGSIPHNSQKTATSRAFRTLHTGIEKDPDATTFERRRPIRLELRKSFYEADKAIAYPYTTVLLLDHIFHIARLIQARHIHLKYVEASGDCYIMFRTEHGLVPYSTINNKHWIYYLMMHATGQEDPKEAGEGEFRLEVVSDKDGRMEYTVNIVYIQGGMKLTLSPVY